MVADDGFVAVLINLCDHNRWSFITRLLVVEILLCWQVVLVHVFALLLLWTPWMFLWDLVGGTSSACLISFGFMGLLGKAVVLSNVLLRAAWTGRWSLLLQQKHVSRNLHVSFSRF